MRARIHAVLLVVWLVFGLGYDSRADVGNCPITDGQVTLSSSVLYYRQAGTGPHILLLHGLFANKEQWNNLLCLLSAAGHTAIAPDLPGYGQSIQFPITDYPLEKQVDRLRQLMDALGIAHFDLAGSSMGGTIAALYVRRYPRQVRTLAFIGSPLGIVDWSPRFKEAIYQGVNPLIPIDLAQFDLEMSLLFFKPPPIPESQKVGMVQNYLERNRHYQQVWDIVNLYDSALADGPTMQIPTLILWGVGDGIFAIEGMDRLRYRFPHGKRVQLPDAGHLPQLENPGATARIYLDFLQQHPAGQQRGR